MQAPSGSASYEASDAPNSIKQMILEGVKGTPGGPGLIGYLDGVSWISPEAWGSPYLAVHLYNAGHLSQSNNLQVAEGGNARSKVYANDISSRLTGWNGGHGGCVASVQCPGQLRPSSDCV